MKTNIMQHIKAAANTITSTRDFCGNELEAVKDYCCDNNIEFSKNFFCSAMGVADQNWAADQIAAGVMR